MRFFAGALGVGVSFALAAVACTSFSEPAASPDAGTIGDAGGTADAGATDATNDDGSVARGCPATLPANSVCFDFSSSDAPTGDQTNGAFAVDQAQPWSAPSSLAVSTAGNTLGSYAYLSHPITAVPKAVSFDQYVRVGMMPETEIGEISVRGPSRYYGIVLVLTGNKLELYDSIHEIGGVLLSTLPHPLGMIRTDDWVRLTVDVELAGFDGTTPTRKLTAKVDGATRFEADGPVPGVNNTALNPEQTLVEIGISWAGEDPTVPRKMNVDDVFIRWTP